MMNDDTTDVLGFDEALQPPEPAASVAPDARQPAELRPRIRWAGIVWGLVFAAIAATMLWIVLEPARIAAVLDWWATLTPAGLILTVLLVLGGLLLVAGLSALGRRAEADPAGPEASARTRHHGSDAAAARHHR